MEKAKIIGPHVPLFGSSRVSAFLHILFRKKSVRRCNGLYKVGHGEKSVIWYWEFNMEKRYFHQFRTIDYAAAVDSTKRTSPRCEEKRRKKVTQKTTRKTVREGGGPAWFWWPYCWVWTRGAAWGRDWCSRPGWQRRFQRQRWSAGQWGGAKRESRHCSFLNTELVPSRRHLCIILVFFFDSYIL